MTSENSGIPEKKVRIGVRLEELAVFLYRPVGALHLERMTMRIMGFGGLPSCRVTTTKGLMK